MAPPNLTPELVMSSLELLLVRKSCVSAPKDISLLSSPECWMLSETIRFLPVSISVLEVILPNTVTTPVPDKVPSKNVFPLIPRLLPNCIALVVVAPLSVTSCKVSEPPTCEST